MCALGLVLTAGCAASSGAAGGSGVVRLDLGRAPSPALLADVAATVLQSFGFELTSVSSDLIQTDWRVQGASDALRASGAQQVRDRAEVFVRSRASDYYIGEVRITFEAFVDGRWRAVEVSDAAAEQYARLQETATDRLSRYMNQN